MLLPELDTVKENSAFYFETLLYEQESSSDVILLKPVS